MNQLIRYSTIWAMLGLARMANLHDDDTWSLITYVLYRLGEGSVQKIRFSGLDAGLAFAIHNIELVQVGLLFYHPALSLAFVDNV